MMASALPPPPPMWSKDTLELESDLESEEDLEDEEEDVVEAKVVLWLCIIFGIYLEFVNAHHADLQRKGRIEQQDRCCPD